MLYIYAEESKGSSAGLELLFLAGRVGGSLESEAIKFSFHFSMLLGSAQLRSCQPLQCKVTEKYDIYCKEPKGGEPKNHFYLAVVMSHSLSHEFLYMLDLAL